MVVTLRNRPLVLQHSVAVSRYLRIVYKAVASRVEQCTDAARVRKCWKDERASVAHALGEVRVRKCWKEVHEAQLRFNSYEGRALSQALQTTQRDNPDWETHLAIHDAAHKFCLDVFKAEPDG